MNTEINNKLVGLLSEGFERLVTWNKYKSKIGTVATVTAEGRNTNTKRIVLDTSFQGVSRRNTNTKRIVLDTSFQGVSRLFVTGFDNNSVKRNSDDAQSHKKYYLRRIEIKNYNVLIDGRNFHDQNVNDSITRYTELLQFTTERLEDYSTRSLIDYNYYNKDYNIATIDLSHQSVHNSYPKAIQQIEFIYKLDTNVRTYILTVLEKEKEASLKFSKGTVKVY